MNFKLSYPISHSLQSENIAGLKKASPAVGLLHFKSGKVVLKRDPLPTTTNVKDGPNDASNGKATTADENGAKTAQDGIKAADSGRYIIFLYWICRLVYGFFYVLLPI